MVSAHVPTASAGRSPRLLHLLLVVFPTLGAAVGAYTLVRQGEARARFSSATWVARAAGVLLRHDMAEAVERLLAEAPATSRYDPDSPGVQAALRGDTVAALGADAKGLTLSLFMADSPAPTIPGGGGGPRAVRTATVPFRPPSFRAIAAATGVAPALYLRGRRVLGDAESAPDELPRERVEALGRRPGGVPLAPGTPDPVLVALDPAPPRPPSSVLLTSPVQGAATDGRTRTLLPVLLALLAALGLGGTILVSRSPGSGAGHAARGQPAPPPSRSRLGLSALLPLLVLWAVVLVAAGEERNRRSRVTIQELSAAATVARTLSGAGLARLEEATGFGVARLRPGVPPELSPAAVPVGELLAVVPPPPPTFLTSGILHAPEGKRPYAAVRDRERATLVLVGEASGGLPQRAWFTAAAGAGTLGPLLFLLLLGRRSPETRG